MDSEVIQGYINLLHQIVLSGEGSDMNTLVAHFDSLRDGTDSLLPSFQKKGSQLPAYWISYLRVAKFALNYRSSYMQHYEFYLRLYDHLRTKEGRTPDEDRMIHELSQTLYQMDDLSGHMERAVQGLMDGLRKAILESHNIVTESRDRIIAGRVAPKAVRHLNDPYHELVATVTEIIGSAERERTLHRICMAMAPQELRS